MSGRTDAVSGTEDWVTSAVPGGNSGIGPAPRPYVSGWTMGSYLELSALPSAVTSARLHARLVVNEWGLGKLAGDVELVVSELVTNAVQASAGLVESWWIGQWIPGIPPVRLWLRANRTRVLMQVWDGNEGMPQRQVVAEVYDEREGYQEYGRDSEREKGLDSERGRGLLIVECLCERYGVYTLDGSSGKVVWGEISGS